MLKATIKSLRPALVSSPNGIPHLASQLMDKIRQREIAAGQRLPSRTQLASEFGCAPSTVSGAIKVLVKRKLVDAVPGRGVFVRSDHDSRTRALTLGLIGWFGGHTNATLLREDNWWRGIYTSLVVEARKQNCSVLLVSGTDSDPFDVKAVLKHRLDVVVSYGIRMRPETVTEFRRAGLPLLLITPLSEQLGISCVSYDTFKAIRDMVRIFQEHGHKHIGFLALKTLDPERLERVRQVFYTELASRELIYNYNNYWRVIEADRLGNFRTSVRDGARREMKRLLDLPEPPTALYCLTADMGEGAAEVAAERGLKIGKDLSLIVTSSFEEDSPFNMFLEPHDALAQKLIVMARGLADDPDRSCQVEIPHQYIDKGSVARV